MALWDQSKELDIYGHNEKTILYIDAIHSTIVAPYGRKPGICISKGTVLRNLAVVFEPVATDSYTGANNAILYAFEGSMENVFIRTIGSNIPSYLYGGRNGKVKNCSFFHDLGQVTNNWDATALFSDIATNVETKGSNTNVIIESFGTSDMSLEDLIKASRENTAFQENQVGIFYGEHAWK